MVWEPFALALAVGCVVSAGLAFVLWRVGDDDETQ